MTRNGKPSFEELINESYDLETTASKIQNGKAIGLSEDEIKEFIRRYQRWLGKCLSVLPEDLHDSFRSEYKGGFFSRKIKDFLEEPTTQSPFYSEDSPEIFGYWSYPYETCFRIPLLNQRQILEEAGAYEKISSVTPVDAKLTGKKPRVFLVHGHNERYLHECARKLEKLDLDVIVLREQPNKGRTIIEKFEDYSDVNFAIVILTADDRGGLRTARFEDQNFRARQNVILELGFFLGKLRRGHVCALYEDGVEIPSDYQGVLFIPLSPQSDWFLQLVGEIAEAGVSIDLNKLRGLR